MIRKILFCVILAIVVWLSGAYYIKSKLLESLTAMENSNVDFEDKASIVMILKGILHQKIFYCLNLIFWIIMGCGIARFGRKGLKTTKT